MGPAQVLQRDAGRWICRHIGRCRAAGAAAGQQRPLARACQPGALDSRCLGAAGQMSSRGSWQLPGRRAGRAASPLLAQPHMRRLRLTLRQSRVCSRASLCAAQAPVTGLRSPLWSDSGRLLTAGWGRRPKGTPSRCPASPSMTMSSAWPPPGSPSRPDPAPPRTESPRAPCPGASDTASVHAHACPPWLLVFLCRWGQVSWCRKQKAGLGAV